MPLRARSISIALTIALILIVLTLIRRRKLHETYSLFWFAAAFLLFLTALWTDMLLFLREFFGASSANSVIFTLGFLFVFLFLLHLSVTNTKMRDQIRQLSQSTALLHVEQAKNSPTKQDPEQLDPTDAPPPTPDPHTADKTPNIPSASVQVDQDTQHTTSTHSASTTERTPKAIDTPFVTPKTDTHENPRQKLLAWGLLLLILLGFGFLKYTHNQGPFRASIDGGYYTNIAQNVRDGKGVTTNLSLYHHGYPYFPYPTPVYPVWPLVYGTSAKWIPLKTAGTWLPTLGFFLALLFAYLWAARAFAGPLFPSILPGFHAGHALALTLGLQRDFYWATSRPYTEGLAYTILFAMLWRFQRLWPRPSLRAGAEMGLWIALLTLTRGQWLIAGIAATILLAWAILASRPRKAYLLMAIGFFVGFGLLYGSWYTTQRSTLQDPSLFSIVRFDQARATNLLSPIINVKPTHGLWDFLKDRAQGLKFAFQFGGHHSYTRGFYLLPYALLLALPFMLFFAVFYSTLANLKQALRWLRAPENLPLLFVVTLAGGALLQIHAIHLVYFSKWYFGLRHSLVCILPFFLCWLFLAKCPWHPAPAIAVFLFVASTWMGVKVNTNMSFKQKAASKSPQYLRHTTLVNWLRQEVKRRGPVDVVMHAHEPQRIAWSTPGVNYHWIYRYTQSRELHTLFDKLNADYLVLPQSSYYWPLRRPTRVFLRNFKKLRTFGFLDVFVYRRKVVCGTPLRKANQYAYPPPYARTIRKHYRPYRKHRLFWGQHYKTLGKRTLQTNFRALAAGFYCIEPAALLYKDSLLINGRHISSPVFQLPKGGHILHWRGHARRFSILWRPTRSKHAPRTNHTAQPASRKSRTSTKLQPPRKGTPQTLMRGQVSLGPYVRVVGFTVKTRSVYPGGTLRISYLFQALRKIPSHQRIFFHVNSRSPRLFINGDFYSKLRRRHPCYRWKPKEYVWEHQNVPIPTNLPPGSLLRVTIGMWGRHRRQPILGTAGAFTIDGKRRLLIAHIPVMQPPDAP